LATFAGVDLAADSRLDSPLDTRLDSRLDSPLDFFPRLALPDILADMLRSPSPTRNRQRRRSSLVAVDPFARRLPRPSANAKLTRLRAAIETRSERTGRFHKVDIID
jgi:hypothetical protein